jgi:hypothetical protein
VRRSAPHSRRWRQLTADVASRRSMRPCSWRRQMHPLDAPLGVPDVPPRRRASLRGDGDARRRRSQRRVRASVARAARSLAARCAEEPPPRTPTAQQSGARAARGAPRVVFGCIVAHEAPPHSALRRAAAEARPCARAGTSAWLTSSSACLAAPTATTTPTWS